MYLTHDQASTLLKSCTTLSRLLNRQKADIHVLVSTPSNLFYAKLMTIHERQSRLQQELNTVIDVVQKWTEPWLEELKDAGQSMYGRIIRCNAMSRPDLMGYEDAARQYWPLMLDTHEHLSRIVQRLGLVLQTALADEALWTRKAQRRSWIASIALATQRSFLSSSSGSTGRHVSFSKTVRVQALRCETTASSGALVGQSRYVEYTTALTTDRKKTAGKLKSGK